MYKLNKNSVLRLSDSAVIPLDKNNTDYQNYLAWVTEGNQPQPADPEPTTQETIVISPWQLRKALNQLGLRAAVESIIQNTDNQDMKDAWEYATEVRRDDALVIAMGVILNMTSQDLDDVFKMAKDK